MSMQPVRGNTILDRFGTRKSVDISEDLGSRRKTELNASKNKYFFQARLNKKQSNIPSKQETEEARSLQTGQTELKEGNTTEYSAKDKKKSKTKV